MDLPAKTRQPLIVIGAVANNMVVGAGNKMPWHAPDDLRHFKQLTYGGAVIMGRRTWDGLASPLTGRQNIVLSEDHAFSPMGAQRAESLSVAITMSSDTKPIFVIGGHGPWEEALRIADEIRLTRIHVDVDGDVYFPQIDSGIWITVEEVRNHGMVNGVSRRIDFLTLRRRV